MIKAEAVGSLDAPRARSGGPILSRCSASESQTEGVSNNADTLDVTVSFCLVTVSIISKSSRTPGIHHMFLTISSVITLYASRSSLMYGDSFKWLNLASEEQASSSAASSAEAVACSSDCLAAAFSALPAHLSFAHLAVITEMMPFLHADMAGSAPANMAFFSSGVGGASIRLRCSPTFLHWWRVRRLVFDSELV